MRKTFGEEGGVHSEHVHTFMDAITHRRATAHFTSEPVPEETIDAILTAGSLAPSGFNLQPWRFIVVRDDLVKDQLRDAASGQPKVAEAPVVIVAFSAPGLWKENVSEVFREAAKRGALPTEDLDEQKKRAIQFVDSQDQAVWINRHVMIAFTYMMIAAEVLGWDTAPMEGFDPKKVRSLFELPGEAEVVALLAIGRGVEKDRPFPGRLHVSRIAYNNSIHQSWPTVVATRHAIVTS